MSFLLHHAAAQGNIDEVEVLTHPGVVNLPDKRGRTPLHHAAKAGNVAVAKYLLKHGALPDTSDNTGQVPAMLAVRNGHDDMTTLLLGWPEEEESIHFPFNTTRSPPAPWSPRVAKRNRVESPVPQKAQPSALFDEYEPMLYTKNDPYQDSWTSLHHAAHRGSMIEVDGLLSAKADPDVRDKIGRTPLHLAAHGGHQLVVQQLLSAGADPSARTDDDSTPGAVAVALGHEALADLLMPSINDEVPILRLRGGTAGDKDFISHAKDVARRSLEFASASSPRSPRLSTTEFHRAAGKNSNGNAKELRRLLPDYGINCRDEEGRTAIHYAAESGNIDCVEVLLKNDADLDVVDNNRRTPLHFAAENGQPRICKAFLNHSAAANPKDRSGNTPLHLAAAEGHDNCLHVLLRSGARKDIKNSVGRSPYDLAVRGQHQEAMDILYDGRVGDASPSSPAASGSSPKVTKKSRVVSLEPEFIDELEKLQKRNARLAAERDNLRDELAKSDKKRRTLEDNNGFLSGQIKALKSKLDSGDLDGNAKKQIEQLIEETKAVQDQADETAREYRKEKAELEKQVQNSKEALRQMELLTIELTKDLTREKDEYLAKFNAQMEQMQQAMAQMEAVHANELELKDNHIRDLQQQLEDALRRLREMPTEDPNSKAQIEELLQQVNDYMARIRELEDENRRLKKDNKRLEDDHKELNDAFDDAEAQIKELQKELKKAMKDRDDLRAQLAAALAKAEDAAKVKQLQAELQKSKDDLQKALRDLDDANNEIKYLNELLNERDVVIPNVSRELDDTAAALWDLTKKHKALQAARDQADKNMKQLEDDLARALQERDQARKERDQGNEDIKKLQKALAKAQKDLAAADKDLDAAYQEIDDLKAKLKKMAASLKGAKEELADLNPKYDQALKDKAALEEALRNALQQMKDKAQKHKNEVAGLNSDLDFKNYELDDLKKQNQRLQAALMNAEGTAAALEGERNKLADELEDLRRRLAEMTDRAAVAEDKVDRQNKELGNLDEETQRLHTDRQQWKALAEQLGEESDNLKKEVQRLSDELERLRHENAMLKNEVEKLSEENRLLDEQAKEVDSKARGKVRSAESAADRKCRELQDALEKKETELKDALKKLAGNQASVNAELQRMQAKLDELKKEKDALERENRRLQADSGDKQALEDKVRGLQSAVRDLEDALSASQKHLDKARGRNKDLEKDMKHAKKELDDMHAGVQSQQHQLANQLSSNGRKQDVFTGQQIVDDSVEMTSKAVDTLMESFLMPQKAKDMAVEVARKKEQAKTGNNFAPITP